MDNIDLRKKREEDTVSLYDVPLVIRTKPTAHKQYCYLCGELIVRGERQINMASGMWERGDDGTFRVNKIGRSVARLFPRYIYLHSNCFSCMLKRMFAEAKIPLNPNCEVCGSRFDCYTGNIGIDDIKYKLHQIEERNEKRIN